MEPVTISHAQPEAKTLLEQLHPSLRETFVSLPGNGTLLTAEQLDALFGGDRRALREMAQLILQTPQTEHNKV